MRRNLQLRTTVSAAVMGAAVMGFAGVAAAQEAPATVDDIIVTAQKREQSLQDVPIVVTTLSQEILDGAGVQDIKDLQILTPGMTVTSTQSEASTTVRIRGAGTVGDNPGLESSVGVVIDGVYRSRNSVGFGDLGEMARIEVLKGPQGTLFGKNTSAGVINIITEAPSFTPEFNAELNVGNYGAMGASGSVTGPISDTLAFRLYASRRVRDGFMTIDTGDGPRPEVDDNNQDFGTVRGQLLWLPSDNVSFRLIGDYDKIDENCCIAANIQENPAITAALRAASGQARPIEAADPFSYRVRNNIPSTNEIENYGGSGQIDYDLGNMALTSITAYRKVQADTNQDSDFTGADLIGENSQDLGINTFTQELRVTSDFDGPINFLLGGYYFNEKIDQKNGLLFGDDFRPYGDALIQQASGGALSAAPAATPNRVRRSSPSTEASASLTSRNAVSAALR